MGDKDREPRPLTIMGVDPHLQNLDVAFRHLGKAFSSLTFEQGRVADIYGSAYPDGGSEELAQSVKEIHTAGERLRKLANQVRATAETAYANKEEDDDDGSEEEDEDQKEKGKKTAVK